MDVVKAWCPACEATVRIAPESLVITALPRAGANGRVAMTCPRCRRRVSLAVAADVVGRLRQRGCALAPDLVSRTAHPAGTGRRGGGSRRSDAPPLTHDDLLDLHLLLQRDDWFDQLRELVP